MSGTGQHRRVGGGGRHRFTGGRHRFEPEPRDFHAGTAAAATCLTMATAASVVAAGGVAQAATVSSTSSHCPRTSQVERISASRTFRPMRIVCGSVLRISLPENITEGPSAATWHLSSYDHAAFRLIDRRYIDDKAPAHTAGEGGHDVLWFQTLPSTAASQSIALTKKVSHRHGPTTRFVVTVGRYT